MLHRRLTRTDQSHCPDARPGEQEVVPASEKAGQPASLAFPRLVGSPLHLRHLLQDALPPVHQEQVCHIFLSSSYFLLLESGKTRPWRGSPQQQAWPPWPPSGWSPTINLPHSWPTPSWPTSQSKSQGWSSSVRIYEHFNSDCGTVGRHLAHDVF